MGDFTMFNIDKWQNWVAVVLLIMGIFTYAQWMKKSNKQAWPTAGLVLVFVAAILSLSARYDEKKKNGSKGKLRDNGSMTALVFLAFATLLCMIAMYRKWNGYPDKQPVLMGVAMVILCMGTLMSLFFQVQ